MTLQLLILEADTEFAARLEQALLTLDDCSVTIKSTAKDACLHMMHSPQSLAFVPVTKGNKLIRALRAIQAELRIVVMTPAAEYKVPSIYAGEVQGVLLKSHLEADLATVLHQALNQPFPLNGIGANGDGPRRPMPRQSALVTALQQASIGQLVHSMVFARGTRLLAHWGELNERQAATIAVRVGEEWADASPTTRIQFMHLPARAGDMLLYSRLVDDRFQLTLVASAETALTELRIQSDPLIGRLSDLVAGRQTGELPYLEPENSLANGRQSYVIVWRSAQPMPSSFNIPLRQSFERLASANACVLKEVIVQSELVHIVLTCPAGRDGHWAAYLLKNGSEEAILEEFDLENGLWDPGYYTVESTELLSDAEVNIFLEQHSPERPPFSGD
jgi:hypothetical protein